MFEIGLIVAVCLGAAIAIGRARQPDDAVSLYDDFVDLPCPWCNAQTREDDTACPSCLQPFGERIDR